MLSDDITYYRNDYFARLLGIGFLFSLALKAPLRPSELNSDFSFIGVFLLSSSLGTGAGTFVILLFELSDITFICA